MRLTSRTERGAVTAETAVVLPLLALFTLAMVWMVCVGLTQVRAIDAAREVARAAARSESPQSARSWGRRVAPEGSRISVSADADVVRVTVTSPVKGPAGLLGRLAGVRVRGQAVSAVEPSLGTTPGGGPATGGSGVVGESFP